MVLFAFFGLWETTLLAGAGAVSVPVIIHLLNRRRFRVVTWAAMRFLLAAQRQNTRRMRIEQLVLLLVRTGLVALIVFAMASVMPWAEAWWERLLPDGLGRLDARDQRIHHVLVLDGSLSMNTQADGKSAFEQARQLAIRQVQTAQAGDSFSVLLVKDSPSWIVPEPSPDTRRVVRELEAIRPGHGNGAMSAALGLVSGKLTEASARYPAQAVYFFTDLQRATWQGSAPVDVKDEPSHKEKNPYEDIQRKAHTVFVDVGRDGLANVALSDLAITDEQGSESLLAVGALTRVVATVTNYGAEPQQKLRVELLVGRARENSGEPEFAPRVVDQQIVELLPVRDGKPVVFHYRFPAAGTYFVQTRVEGNDALELDDSRGAVVTVKETVPILLVNGKPAADRYERATEYLRLALNPFAPGDEPKYLPLRPRVISQAQFLDMTDADLAPFDAIYWCDVGGFGPGDLRRAETHLRRGGGLVVALGDHAADNLELYNRLLYKDDHGLLPVRLMKKIVAPPEAHFSLGTPLDDAAAYRLPPLAAFKKEDDKIGLRNARFRQYVQARFTSEGRANTVLAFKPESDATVKARAEGEPPPIDPILADLPKDDPALLEWNPPLGRGVQGALPRPKEGGRTAPLARYRGKVVLMTSTLNMDWSSWPASPSYGAMIQEIARLAVSGRLRAHAAPVGSLLEDYLPGGSELDATVHFPTTAGNLPTARLRTQLVEDVNILRWADTEVSGLYRIVLTGGQELLFALNVPSGAIDQRGTESDLTRASPDDLRSLYPDWEFQHVRDPRLANLTGGPVNIEAKQERVPVGPMLALIAMWLAFALILAEVILAWKFGHYSVVAGSTTPAATGRFYPVLVACIGVALFVAGTAALVILENSELLGRVRNLIETWAGIEPPPAGEGTHWELLRNPFLPAVFGGERWWMAGLALVSALLIFFTYRLEGPTVSRWYKALLGGLRLFLVLATIYVLLPQRQLGIERQGFSDLVLLIDTSRSMGEPDVYQDAGVLERSKKLGDLVRKQLQERLPAKIKALQTELAGKQPQADRDPESKVEVESLQDRLRYWEKQQEILDSTKWRPSRLQLVQALLTNGDRDWLPELIRRREMKIHIFTLDSQGRATRLSDDAEGAAGEITDTDDPRQVERARAALARMEPDGRDSRLGTAVRQVIDHYRGASLSGVVMFTDGVTTRDETIGQASEYAAQKGVPLFLVGIGDDHEIRDLKLHDLQVEDQVYVNDRVLFEARLTGQGYKDLVVPVVLKIKQKDGKEKEVSRELVRVDPQGRSVKVRLRHQPTEVGRKMYIVEVEPPKGDGAEKPIPPSNLRLERYVDVVGTKLIKVLFVEGQPRYEFRYLKFLLERELDEKEKKKRTIDLNVVLLDADDDFAAQDKTALADFPATLDELNKYDVVILGDCDPQHKKLGTQRLRNLASFARGEDEKGRKLNKSGGGLLFIAGSNYNPHSYRGTPLADVLPVEPQADKAPPEPAERKDKLRPELTPMGRMHPIFRFSPDEAESLSIWQRLAPLYFYARGYRIKPLAEVLAVHPTEKALVRGANQDDRHPLVVQQFVGTGRSMFFGFDESWRWRLREDEARYNNFWIQTIRYLSRGRSTRTDLRLDRQTAYRLGEPIKVTVRFPDNIPGQGPNEPAKVGAKTEVRVTVEYRPGDTKDGVKEPEVQTLQLAKVEGSWGTYEGALNRTREGKFRFRLISPDVSATQPDGEKPSAEATVELPPGELDRLRMNDTELRQAAEATQGNFYTLATAENVLEDLPPGYRVSLTSATPPILLWNHWLMFALIMFLVTSEWLLRKRKHLL